MGANFFARDKKLCSMVVANRRGAAGIATATLLKDAGLTVAVLEADRIVKDVTVGTTAKISAAPNLVYDRLLSKFGKAIANFFRNIGIHRVNDLKAWMPSVCTNF